jgi:hypothetical protein
LPLDIEIPLKRAVGPPLPGKISLIGFAAFGSQDLAPGKTYGSTVAEMPWTRSFDS